MTYNIKRLLNGIETVVKTVRPTGTQTKRAMGESVVDMSFTLPVYVEFKINDFVQVYGETYRINVMPSVKKVAARKYEYNIQFEAVFYDLAKVQLQFLNSQNQLLEPVFNLMGNAATIVGLIVENANRHSAGWTVGVVDDTPYQNFSFNAENCLQVLNRLASDFETEFWIDNKTIHLQKREQSSGLQFEYGKGKGLYSIARANKSNANIITRLYVRGGSRNLRPDYGATSLLLPNGATYIEDATKVALYGLIEATQIFENIFPEYEGTVSAVVAGDGNWDKFTDASIDFDVNSYALATPAKVAFNTGQLAGYEFELSSYNHATKQFTIKQNNDEALKLPTNLIRPAVGDKFVLLDIRMPQVREDAAENKLQLAGQTYYDKNSDPALNFAYSVDCDPIWFAQQNINVVLGNTVVIYDADLGINGEIRIAGYKRDLQTASRWTLEISDSVGANEIIRQYAQQQRTLQLLESSGLLDINQIRKNIFLNRLSEQNGYLMLAGQKVKAGIADYTPEAGHAMIANEAVNADLWDGKQFADYLNQPVRDTDDVTFKSVKGKSFVSGAFGSGFRIDENGNAEFDSLVIRKSFQATEFILQKVRASNGAIAVTDSSVVKSVINLSDYTYKCFIETDGGNIAPTFLVDDLVRCQVFDGASFKYIFARVTDVGDDYFTLYLENATIAPVAGDTFVRVGSVSNANRQGLIYMSNADSGAPFIDVLDGVNSESLAGKTKVRLGKLDGIVDPDLGALAGYGIYAQNGYFKGKFIVTGGNAQTIAGSQALANAAQANAISAAATDATAKANAAEANAQVMLNALKVGGRNFILNSIAIALNGNDHGNSDNSVDGKITVLNNNNWNSYDFFSVSETFAVGEDITFGIDLMCSISATVNVAVMPHYPHTNIVGQVSLVAGIWKRAYVTGAVLNNDNNAFLCGLYGTEMDGAVLHYKGAKLEKGTKSTDWTPAPEDVDAAVSAANAAAIAAQNANTALVASLKAMAYKDVVELAELGTTIIQGGKIKTNLLDADFIKASVINTAYINSLEIDAGAIKSGTIDSARINASQIVIAGGGATQAYAQALVNGVQVGGRNYQINSEIKSTDGFVIAQAITGLQIDNSIELRVSGSNAGYLWLPILSMPLPVTETITLSFYIKNNLANAHNISFTLNGNNAIFNTALTASQGWTRYTATGIIANYTNAPLNRLLFENYTGSTFDVSIKQIKIERGNKATDWTPAPEDVTGNIEAAKALAISTAASDATAKQLAAEASARAMVKALKVGGRNLLMNTAKFTTADHWMNAVVSGTHDDGSACLRQTNAGGTKYTPDPVLKADTVYTFSFEYYKVGNENVVENFPAWIEFAGMGGIYGTEYWLSSSQNIVQDKWVKCWVTFRTKSVPTTVYVYIYHLGINPSQFPFFTYLKLEEGEKATDWTPAPEEVQAAVNAANAAAIAAQNANAALVASLKAMAYKDVVELAELGTTIIQGGKIKTNLLDADYIKSSIINTAYLNSLEIVTKNLKTAATGKRVEIDSVENNIRFFNDAGDEIMSIDDDSVLERIVHDNTQVPPVDYYYYGPGFRAGARNGKSGNLSRNGLTVWGDDGKLKFKIGDRSGSNDYRITATGIEPDPTSYYYGEDITFTALNGVFDLRKADGGTVKVTFIDGLLMRIGNPDVLAYWNNIVGSATVQYAPCGAGEVGTSHTRTVAVGTVKGTSQADANNKANAQALALAQADAANNGYCRTQIYRIIFSNNYDSISYAIKDIDDNPVSIPVNISVNYYISSANGSRNENATIYGGNSFGTLIWEGASIYDFIANYTTPNQYNDIPIWTEMQ